MNLGTSVGHAPHARQEASPAKRSDARCACGARAAGYDARREEPACRVCAALRADGGPDTEATAEPQAPAGELVTDGGTKWSDLSAFQRDILEAIAGLESAGTDPYGLAIEEDLEEYYDDVLHSRLYQNLDSLIDDGFVDRSELDGRTNSYTLTTEAKALLEESVRRRADACGLQMAATDGGDR